MTNDLYAQQRAHELKVNRLNETEVGDYLALRFPQSVFPTRLAQILYRRSEGNPLFLQTMVQELVQSGVLVQGDDGLWAMLGEVAELETWTPESVQQVLARQQDRLGSEEHRVLEAASLAGLEFSAASVAAALETETIGVEEHCNRLVEQHQFLRLAGMSEWPDGTRTARYGFLHALYQEFWHEQVGVGQRQQWHLRIGERQEHAYGEHAKEIAAELAVHFEQGRDYGKAVQYLQKAGMNAVQRSAHQEAIAHLNQGMRLIDTLPPSPERDGQELDLRTPLGMAWIAFGGWTVPEVWSNLHLALGLAKSLGRREALVPIYYGLCRNVMTQGRLAESLAWANEMLTTAEASGDLALLIVGHRAACITHFWRGDLTQARAHGDRVLALYDEEQHHYLADIMNTDPKSMVGTFVSLGTWMLGYPDRAVQMSEASVAHARRRGHSYNLGWALTVGSYVWDFRCEPVQMLARAEETEQLGRTYSLPVISEVLAQMIKGVAWLRAGCLAEGIPQLRSALETWNAHGDKLWMLYLRAVLAEGLALSGDSEGGLRLLEESLAQIARPGWEERCHLAEILRLKGWILSLQGDLDGAEQNDLASLDWARQQSAKSWELRTTTSLVRLWQQQTLEQGAGNEIAGKRESVEMRRLELRSSIPASQHSSARLNEAHQMLSEIYNWFTEGFDTKDLQEAKALLKELSQ